MELLSLVEKVPIGAQSRGGVGCLSHEGGVQSVVKSEESLLCDDFPADGEWVGGALGLVLSHNLDSDFDGVDWLDAAGGCHTGESSHDEWFYCF